MNDKIITYDDLPGVRSQVTESGGTIVFVPGVWDNQHSGHVDHLWNGKHLFAKNAFVVAAVGSDRITEEDKGVDRPSIHETDRAEFIADIPFVDRVVVCTEDGTGGRTCEKLVEALQPDIYLIAVDDVRTLDTNPPPYFQEKKKVCDKYGVTLIAYNREPPVGEAKGFSTTHLLGLDRMAA